MSKTKKFKLFFSLCLLVIILLIIVFTLKPKCCFEQNAQSQTYSFTPILSLSPFDVVYGDLNQTKFPIIVYENYLSSFSQLVQSSLDKANHDFSNLVFIFRPYISNQDQIATQMAIFLACANEQNKGQAVRESFIKKADQLDLSEQFIAQHNLNKDQLETCLNDTHLKEALETVYNDAKANNIYGSPTILVGDELVIGARPYEDFIDSGGDKVEGLYSVIARQVDYN
jgi:protein-disulfide isomerase